MRKMVILALILGATAGCSRDDDAIRFDGRIYKAKASKPGDDRADFTVSVEPATGVLEGAREAARYEGTRYCIENFGTSVIAWSVGPDSDASALRIVDNTVGFQGRCKP